MMEMNIEWAVGGAIGVFCAAICGFGGTVVKSVERCFILWLHRYLSFSKVDQKKEIIDYREPKTDSESVTLKLEVPTTFYPKMQIPSFCKDHDSASDILTMYGYSPAGLVL